MADLTLYDMKPTYKLFYASPLPVNFDVSTMNYLGSLRVERCWLQSPPLSCDWGFEKILKRSTIALLLHRISHVAQCVYILTKALPLFLLFLKDILCGARDRWNGSMHMCYIYCKIIQWIHGDDISYKLIKIVHVCGRWMVEMKYSFYESPSSLFG